MKNTARFKCGSCQHMLRDYEGNITHCGYWPECITPIKDLDYCHKKVIENKIREAEQENKELEKKIDPEVGMLIATLDILTRNTFMKNILKY